MDMYVYDNCVKCVFVLCCTVMCNGLIKYSVLVSTELEVLLLSWFCTTVISVHPWHVMLIWLKNH